MTSGLLRIAALSAYLGAWLVLTIAAMSGAIPRQQRLAGCSARIKMPELVGMLLQGAAALAPTLGMKSGRLQPGTLELTGTLALAPLAAGLFVWALRSTGKTSGAEMLTTSGAYAWLRNPIYSAFLAMLVATGLLVSGGLELVVAVTLYLAGSELRIASEEIDLAEKFPASYAHYRLRTRWRVIPGVR